MAGQAVECALKSRILRRERLNRWPSWAERPELYSHDLSRLAALAGLVPVLEEALEQGTAIGLAWLVAKDFSVNRRYPDGVPFPVPLGRDMVNAVHRDGLLTWLVR